MECAIFEEVFVPHLCHKGVTQVMDYEYTVEKAFCAQADKHGATEKNSLILLIHKSNLSFTDNNISNNISLYGANLYTISSQGFRLKTVVQEYCLKN